MIENLASRIMLYLIMGSSAYAQDSGETLERVRACAAMDRAERVECLDILSREVTAPKKVESEPDGWIVSETRSPVDYTPVVTASLPARKTSDQSPLQLSIRCRSGRTDLVIAGSKAGLGGTATMISYQIDNQLPVKTAAGTPAFGSGLAMTGNVVRFLQSLPEAGDLAVQLSDHSGVVQKGSFSLRGIENTRQKLAAACKW